MKEMDAVEQVKLAIIYYSSTGTNYQLARWAEEGAVEAGADARVLKVQELAPDVAIDSNPDWRKHINDTQDVPIATSDDLAWADAIIFSSPTRFGNITSQMRQFIDIQGGLWEQGKLNNKVVSAMSSSSNVHGGQETTLQSIYITMMHWGAIIVPPGYTDESIFAAGGNPYGASVTRNMDGSLVENVEDATKYQAKRTVQVAAWLKKGKQ